MSRDNFPRRDFFKAAAGLLGAGALAGCDARAKEALGQGPGALAADPKPPDGFAFAAFNDLHFRHPAEDVEYLGNAFRHIAADRDIAFSLVAGDIAEEGHEERMRAVKDLLPLLERPAYLVRGNHDNHLSGRVWGDVFGDLNVSFTHQGVTFLGVDSTDGTRKAINVDMTDDTLQWVRDSLPAAPETPTVLFTHFPLMDAGVPPDQTIWRRLGRPRNAHELLGLFEGRRLPHVFCGHFHSRVTDTSTRPGTTLTTNHCLSGWKPNHDGAPHKGYYRCVYRDGTVSFSFQEINGEATT